MLFYALFIYKNCLQRTTWINLGFFLGGWAIASICTLYFVLFTTNMYFVCNMINIYLVSSFCSLMLMALHKYALKFSFNPTTTVGSPPMTSLSATPTYFYSYINKEANFVWALMVSYGYSFGLLPN